MNSRLLEFAGLGWVDPAWYLIALAALILILLIFVIVQSLRISKLSGRLSVLTTGSEGQSLEQSIAKLLESNEEIRGRAENNDRRLGSISGQTVNCLQKVGIIKYDAFNQMGGKLSYALALLNEEDNGFIINCVHGAEGSYSYIKEIRDGQSEIELGTEEKQALDRAIANFSVK